MVNSLIVPNEAFAFNQSSNFSKTNLFKKVSYNKNESASKNSISKIINVQRSLNHNLSSARNFKISNSYKTQIINGPSSKENIACKLTKKQEFLKKINIPIINKKPKYLVKKKDSPIKALRNFMLVNSINNKNNEDTTLLKTYKKPGSELKNIYINPTMTGPYTKPKGLNKEKKYIAISGKKLFNSLEKEK